jgi:hypothetical protein
MLRDILAWAATISALIAVVFWLLSAVFWLLSAWARVPAPPDTGGVGALFGGYLIGQDAKGRYDLHATLEKQSFWNKCAAIAAAIAAFAGAILSLPLPH